MDVIVLFLLFLVTLVEFNLRVNGSADDLWSLASLPQSDGQIFGSVGLKQRNFGWSFLREFLSGQSQVHCWTLSLRLKQLLKALHVQVLGDRQVERERDVVKQLLRQVVTLLRRGERGGQVYFSALIMPCRFSRLIGHRITRQVESRTRKVILHL